MKCILMMPKVVYFYDSRGRDSCARTWPYKVYIEKKYITSLKIFFSVFLMCIVILTKEVIVESLILRWPLGLWASC